MPRVTLFWPFFGFWCFRDRPLPHISILPRTVYVAGQFEWIGLGGGGGKINIGFSGIKNITVGVSKQTNWLSFIKKISIKSMFISIYLPK